MGQESAAIRLLKRFFELYFVKKDLEGTLALLSKEIHWFGTGAFEEVHGIGEARGNLADQFSKEPWNYIVSWTSLESFSIGEGGSCAYGNVDLSAQGLTFHCRISAVVRAEDGEDKIRELHMSAPTPLQNEGEYFPVELTKEKVREVRRSVLGDAVPGGMMGGYIEPHFPFYFVNERMLEHLGYDSEEQFVEDIQGYISNGMHPDDVEMVNREVERQLSKGDEYTVDYRMKKRDGSYIWVHDFGRKMRAEDGREAITSVCIDITDRKEQERVAAETALQMNNLVDSLPGVGIYQIGERRKALYFSDGVAKLAGLSREEYGRVCGDDANELIYPEDRPAATAAMREAAKRREPINCMYRVRGENGALTWFQFCGIPIREEKDGPVYHVVFSPVPEDVQMYHTMLNGASNAIFVSDLSTNALLYLNETGREMLLGDKNASWEGKTCIDLLRQTMDVEVCRKCHISKLKKDAWMEREVLRPDSDRHYTMRGKLIDWNGVAAQIEYVDDDTERYRREKGIQERYEAEESRRMALEKDVLAVGSVNVTKNRLLNLKGSELVQAQLAMGITVEQVSSEVSAKVPDEKQKQEIREQFTRERILERYHSGATEWGIECRHLMTDGGIRWVELYYNLLEQPSTGDLLAYVYMRDINAEKLLKEVVAAVIDRDFDYITCIDGRTGHYVCFPSGTSKVEMPPSSGKDYEKDGREYMRRNVPEDQQGGTLIDLKLSDITAELDRGDDCHMFHDTRCVDGSYAKQDIHFFYMDKESKQILLTSKDITLQIQEQKKKNSELSEALKAAEQASKTKSEFLSKMSHEIRTPLNAIIGLTRLSLENCSEPEVEEDLRRIGPAAEYLLGILNDVLDMSKIESGKLVLHPEPYSRFEFMEDMETVIRPLMEQNGVDFEITASGDFVEWLYLDKLRFKQIFYNLLSNSAKFTPKDGQVRLCLDTHREEDNWVQVRILVRDTGIGMSKEFLEHVFEPFSQEESGSTSKTEGTGLGLPIAKTLAELMGGDLEITSTPGRGTSAAVTMRLKERIPADRPKETAPEELAELAGRRVLLAEDHPLNRMVSIRQLENKDMKVEWVENGADAVKRFSESPEGYFDAILMDVRMPVMDGMDAARAIRALPRADAATVPIVATTANAMPEDVISSREAGMNAHLSKPIKPEVMYRVLAEQIHK